MKKMVIKTMSTKPAYGSKGSSKSLGQGVANTCKPKGKMK